MTGPTQVLLPCVFIFVYGTVTLCGDPLQNLPLTTHNQILESYNPAEETSAVWAVPISLAATDGIDFSLYSTGYLDVSVHRVDDILPMYSAGIIRESRDHSSFANSPKLFADFHALHRLLTPRHPPCALNSLTITISNSQIITTHSILKAMNYRTIN